MSSSTKHSISPLFGEVALNLGLCRPAEVLDALSFQEEQRDLGLTPPRLGQILVRRGHLTPDDVRRAMEEVERRTRTLDLPGFEPIHLVSRGTSTLVFRGVTAATRRTVTIKFLRFGLAECPESLERFHAECGPLARLDHPNVVRVLESGDLEGIPFLVMEHFPGPDLGALAEESGPLPEARAVRILSDVAAGLDHAHTLGVLHGALRPEAVLVPRLRAVKVTDFQVPDWPPHDPARTVARAGHPEYTAPEQARRTGRVTVRTDVYALGAVFFFMLTGRPPFRGSYRQVVRQHLRRPPPDVRVLAPSVSEGTALLVSLLLAKDPEKRPASMEEVIRRAERLEARGDGPEGGGTERRGRSSAAAGRLLARRR